LTGSYVVIPYKDHPEFTVPLLGSLVGQGGVDGIVLLDNGSSDDTRREIRSAMAPGVVVHQCPGMNIHEMWNLGLRVAASRSRGGPHNVLVLNNDVVAGEGLVKTMAGVLRSDDSVAVVCPNYDGRPGEGAQDVTDHPMHTGHYDGTEGLCGWAFMLRGEDGHRFPEDLHWWFGDNDLLLETRRRGRRVAIALGASCRHLNSGTLRVQEEPYRTLVRLDRERFVAKWGLDDGGAGA
jgi:GT2 family glycosyltransferase